MSVLCKCVERVVVFAVVAPAMRELVWPSVRRNLLSALIFANLPLMAGRWVGSPARGSDVWPEVGRKPGPWVGSASDVTAVSRHGFPGVAA